MNGRSQTPKIYSQQARLSRFRREGLPVPRVFYEREGFRLGRPNSKGWSMAQGQPPCHKSESGKSFSINVNHGGFKCFGCGKKGDMVAFVQLRDHLDFKTAAQSLGAWDEAPSPETVRRLAEQARARDQQRQLEEERTAEDRWRRLQLRDKAHEAARHHREASERLTELRSGATPASGGEEEACWVVMALAFDDLRDCERDYCAAAGLEYYE